MIGELSNMKQMPHLRTWKRMLIKRRGKQQAETITARVQNCYHHLLINRPSVSNHAQSTQLESLILPGLALYQVMCEEGQNRQEVFAEVEDLFKAAFFVRLRNLVPLLNYLADPFPVIRVGLRWMTKNAYVTGSQEVIEDSPQCFAINIHRCFIFDTLQAYGAAELTVLYCKTDDWLAECLPKVHWLRTKTLGCGDKYCDFRWCRSCP